MGVWGQAVEVADDRIGALVIDDRKALIQGGDEIVRQREIERSRVRKRRSGSRFHLERDDELIERTDGGATQFDVVGRAGRKRNAAGADGSSGTRNVARRHRAAAGNSDSVGDGTSPAATQSATIGHRDGAAIRQVDVDQQRAGINRRGAGISWCGPGTKRECAGPGLDQSTARRSSITECTSEGRGEIIRASDRQRAAVEVYRPGAI